MKNIHFSSFLLIFFIFKNLSSEEQNTEITIKSIFLDNKKVDINEKIDIKTDIDLAGNFNYNIANLIEKIKTKETDIEKYSLIKIEKENNGDEDYDGYSQKIMLINNGNINLYFEKKKNVM